MTVWFPDEINEYFGDDREAAYEAITGRPAPEPGDEPDEEPESDLRGIDDAFPSDPRALDD